MRKIVSTTLITLGFIGGILNASLFVRFMWALDWGHMMTRWHNLMLVLTVFGPFVAFAIVLVPLGYLAILAEPGLQKELGMRE